MKIEDVLVQRLQKRKREQAGHCQRGTEDGFKRIEAQLREAKRVRRHEMAAASTSPSPAPPRSWRGEAAAPGDVACKLVQVQQHRQHQYLLLQIQHQILLAQRHHRRTTAATAATSSSTVGCAAATRRRASLCRQQSTKTTMAAATPVKVKTEKSENDNKNDVKATKKNEESTFGGSNSSSTAGLLHFSYPLSSASLSLPFFPSSSLSASPSAPLTSTTWLPLPLPAGERCGAVRLPPLVSLFAEPS